MKVKARINRQDERMAFRLRKALGNNCSKWRGEEVFKVDRMDRRWPAMLTED